MPSVTNPLCKIGNNIARSVLMGLASWPHLPPLDIKCAMMEIFAFFTCTITSIIVMFAYIIGTNLQWWCRLGSPSVRPILWSSWSCSGTLEISHRQRPGRIASDRHAAPCKVSLCSAFVRHDSPCVCQSPAPLHRSLSEAQGISHHAVPVTMEVHGH